MQGAIDCHAHVFNRMLPRISTARYVPHRDAPVAEYRALLDAHGMAGGVLVQPSFLGTDNTHLLEAIASAPGRLRGIAVVARDAPPEVLDDLAAGGIAGIRFNLLGAKEPGIEALATPALFREVARRGWHIEVHAEPDWWPALLPALTRAGVCVVVDHFGRPSGPRCPGFQAILKAARDLDLRVKLSAPYRFGPQHAAECAAALHDAFGPDRLVWGSDWPWTQHPEIDGYDTALRWLAGWLPDPALRRRILVDSPRALYGFH